MIVEGAFSPPFPPPYVVVLQPVYPRTMSSRRDRPPRNEIIEHSGVVRNTKRGARVIPTKAPVVFEPRPSQSTNDIAQPSPAADNPAATDIRNASDPITEYEYAEASFDPSLDQRRKVKVGFLVLSCQSASLFKGC